MGNTAKSKYASQWEEVRKKKKEEEEQNSSSSNQTSKSKYASQWEEVSANKFVMSLSDRLNNYSTSVDELNNSYKTRFFDENGNFNNTYRNDATDAKNTYYSSKLELEKEAKDIISGLEKYGKYLDADTIESVRKYLTGSYDSLNGIMEVYAKDSEYNSQWENEEAYKRDMNNYQYAQKYANATYADLQVAKKSAQGAELDWLNAHDTEIQYVETMTDEELQILKTEFNNKQATLTQELVELEKKKAEIEKNGSRTDPTSWEGYSEIVARIQQIREELKTESPVLYVDHANEAVTIDDLERVRGNEATLAQLEQDLESKGIYDTVSSLNADSEELSKTIDLLNAYSSNGMTMEYLTDEQRKLIEEMGAKYGINTTNIDVALAEAKKAYSSVNAEMKNQKEALVARGYDWDALEYHKEWVANKDKKVEQQKKDAAYATEHPVLATLENIVLAPMQIVDFADNLIDTAKYGYASVADDTYINKSETYSSTISSMIDTKVYDAVYEETGVQWVAETTAWLASGAYSGATSVAQNALTTAACTLLFGPGAGKGVALAIMGTEAAASAYHNAVVNGSTNGEAILTATASGLAEAVFEKISLDKLFDIGKMYDVSSMSALIKSMLKNSGAAFAQGGVEASEEFFTEIANKLADEIINGDHSAYNTAVANYKKMGYSDADARQIASKDALNDVVTALYGGFIGGIGSGTGASVAQGAMATPTAIMNQNLDKAYYTSQGKNIVDNGQLSQLVSATQDLGKVKGSRSLQSLANKVAEANIEATDTKGQAKHVQQVGKLYKGVQQSQLSKIAKATKTETELNSFKELVKAELKAAGVENVDKAADVIVKSALNNGKLTREESSIFNSVRGRTIIDKVLRSDDLQLEKDSEFEQVRAEYKTTKEIARYDSTRTLRTEQIRDLTGYDTTSGATKIEASGEEVEVTSIESFTGDDAKVKLDNGDIISVAELTVNNDVAVIINGLKMLHDEGMIGVPTANYIMELASGTDMDAEAFMLAAADAISLGSINYKEILDTDVNTRTLPENIRQELFKKGQEYSKQKAESKAKALEKAKEERKESGKGKIRSAGNVTFKGIKYEDLNKSQKAQVEMLSVVFGEIGLNVEFFASPIKNGVRVGVNGSYNRATNTVSIDVFAGNRGEGLMLFTAAHELTHFIREWSPVKFKLFADFLLERYAANGIEVKDLINNKIKQSKEIAAKNPGRKVLTFDAAYEEVVADACESFLRDSNAKNTLVALAQQDKSLYERVVSWIKDFAKLIKKAISALNGKTPESKESAYVLNNLQDDLQKLHELWDEALLDARANLQWVEKTEKNTTYEGDVKMQYRGLNDEGIEVYETSEKLKSLSLKERKGLLIDAIRNEYVGRTAKFNKNGTVYYATLDTVSARKSLYGDKKSDKRGYKAKINIGADGNYFELVENALYDSSKDEVGKTTNTDIHDNVAQWDYYIKTVISDGRYYKVLINVADKGNNQYVYDVSLKEIKKGETSSSSNATFNQEVTPDNSISNLAENVNTIAGIDYEELESAKNENGDEVFQIRAIQHDVPEYRALLEKYSDMSTEQIDSLFDTMNKAFAIIEDNLEILDYAWDENLNEDGTWDDTVDARAFNPVKANSDKLYKYSLDFSTLCRKRLLQQVIAEELSLALDRAVTKAESIAIRDELIKLQEEGKQIEIACALCYVESVRMKSPEQIQRFLDDAGQKVREFFAAKAKGDVAKAEENARKALAKKYAKEIKEGSIPSPMEMQTTKTGKTKFVSLKKLPSSMAWEIREAKRAAKSNYSPSDEEQRIIDIANNLPTTTFTTAEGLKNLAKEQPEIFDAYTSFVRNATHSKGTEKDVWYRVGDVNKIGEDLIAAMNKENGLRSQSWSDFQVIHLLDYVAAIIELSTKKAKMQAYTKVPDYVNLMGLTGQMINLSLIPTREFNGKLEFDSVEGMAFKIALELRDKYPDVAGTISIGITNEQIQMLLASVDIDYVIPYHHSSMSKVLRKAMHIPTWISYESYQGEKNITSKKDALENAKKYGVKLLDASDANYHKAPSFSEWFDIEVARKTAQLENLRPTDAKAQKKYGVMYGAYKAMQEAANTYLELCAERGLTPKFCHENADFTVEENYWKLLIDRKMINQKTGEIIEQKPVQPIFNETEVLNILNNEIARYEGVKEDFDYATHYVVERFLNGDMNEHIADVAKGIGETVNNITKVAILDSDIKNQDRDSEGRELSPEQVEYFKDSKVRDSKGNLLVVRHGTDADFNIFDFSKSGKNGKAEGYGFYFSDDKEITNRYGGNQIEVYLNISKPMFNNKRTITKKELTQFVNDLIDFNIEKYKDDGLVWQDSFISNYVNTYEVRNMSRRYAVQQFVNQIWEYNENDQDLIFEVANADGDFYDSDSAKEFYGVLTKSIGYDGIIAEWEHADGTSKVYVTFESKQSKRTSNLNPTDNEDIRYQDRVTPAENAEYLELAKNPEKNEARLRELVDMAAKKAGYDVKAYHGTNQFGFTKFDASKSDDESTLFFTDNIRVASTYAGRDTYGVKRIADAKSFKYEKGKIYTEEELKEAHDFIQSKWHVYGVTKINVEKQTLTHAGTRYSAKQIMEMADRIAKEGIYGVYLNTNNVLEIDVNYASWNSIRNPLVDEWKWKINYKGNEDFNYFKAKADDMFHLELLKNGETVHNGTIQFSEMHSLLRKAIGTSRTEMAIRHATDGSGMGNSKFETTYSDKNGNYANPRMTTREFAKYAKEQGYDGVAIKNMYDWGSRNTPTTAKFVVDNEGVATIYILFDSNRIKSADLVTYDDSGNIIPLSERFNEGNEDIRYSDRDIRYGKLTQERIDFLIADSGAKFDIGYATSWIAEINPSDFINLTLRYETRNKGREVFDTEIEGDHGGVMGDWDYLTELKKGYRMPYLRVDIDTGKVLGHNGRHRMRALEEAGASRTPIVIEFVKDDSLYKGNNNGEILESIDVMRLTSQFDDEWYKSEKAYIHSIIPLNEDHRAEIEKRYRASKFETEHFDVFAYQDRPISNREILVDALSNSDELSVEDKNRLEIYGKKIDQINELEKELADTGKKIHKLITTSGSDRSQIKVLSAKSDKLRQKITRADGELLRIEAMQPVQKLIELRKKQLLKTYNQKTQEQRRKNVEGRNKTALKNKLKNVIKQLDSLYNNGTKERNVKIDLRDTVEKALILSDVLLDNGQISNKQILEGNITTRLSEWERNLVNEWKATRKQREGFLKRIEAMEEKFGKDMDIKAHQALLNSISNANKKMSSIEKKLLGVLERQRAELEDDSVKNAINALAESYASLKDSKISYVQAAYNEYVYKRLDALRGEVQNTKVNNMTYMQLREVYDAYKMVLTAIRTSNEIFLKNKRMSVEDMGTMVIEEVRKIGKTKEERNAIEHIISDFSWKELKPIFAFERIGSKTLLELFNEARRGEDTFAKDVDDAKQYINDKRTKYGYDSWDMDKKYEFKLVDGRVFSITLQEMMSIYAYSKREQALDHISDGGFVFDNRKFFLDKNEKGLKGKIKKVRTTTEAYRLGEFELENVVNSLTADQKKFVDDMQDYLSVVMGEKGNEVSRVLYGIDLFKEKYYFPLVSSEDFIFAANNPAGEIALRNSGMTKATVPHATNPIVLDNFEDVWASHVNKMSLYHSFVLPIENLNKVHNYTGYARNNESFSVSTILSGVFGEPVNDYITNFIKDLNGGVVSQGATSPFAKMFTNFKKTAVAASTSVVVQQPTAILRAMAMINPKYFKFKGDMFKPNKAWEEIKKYAPIAILKEIGGFDVGGGKQIADYITDSSQYDGVKAKAKAFFTDSDYRDKTLMSPAGKADELGWGIIWSAVQQEIKDTTTLKVGSEEFYNACGERFTEVVTYTQVYDSVFSRSAYMRSKNDITKMATAFMGEPTTSFNMMYNAVLQAKRGNIGKGKAIGIVSATVSSIILAAIAKSFIYALRDDDEDESYVEKYLASLVDSLASDLFIPNMLPFIKDITSMLQGWDVERTDMAIFKDIKDAVDGLDSSTKSTYRKVEDILGAVASLFGIPLGNVMRTGREIYNAIANIFDDNQFESGDFEDAILGETTVSDINEALEHGDTNKANKLLKEVIADKVKSGKTEKEAKAAVRSSVTSYWKPLYLEAYRNNDTAEMLRIRRILQSTGLYDSVPDTCSDWIKGMKDETETKFKKW